MTGDTREKQIPAYLRLYRTLVNDITAGVYPYGSKLPSKRVMADEKGVSVITVEHAVDLLNEEGYVQSRQRSGVFVTYRVGDLLIDTEMSDEDGDDMSSPLTLINKDEKPQDTGEFPFSVLARTMRKVLLDYGEKILVKSANHGCLELRDEICHYLARSRGMHVDSAQVIIGAGTEYLYGLIAQLLGPGRIFAIEDPSYNKIRSVYEAMGITCDMLPLTADGIATSELEA